MKNCIYYGKYPFCRRCRFNDEKCEYYDMLDNEKQEYDNKFEYYISEKGEEMLED